MDLDKLLASRKTRTRSVLVDQYGPALVHQAEHNVLIGILIASDMFTAQQLTDYTAEYLAKQDAARKRAAGIVD